LNQKLKIIGTAPFRPPAVGETALTKETAITLDLPTNKINFSKKSINNTVREVASKLTPEQRIIESMAFKRIDDSSNEILNDYFNKKGKVVNTDEFRNYFRKDGYTGSNSASVQEPASELAKKAYSKALKNDGKYATLFAGGSGTGKTSAIKNIHQKKS
jgi:hypothetical protein